MDGRYEDWEGRVPVWTDSEGDSGISGIDFGKVWIANDSERLYFRIETGIELNLQEDNSLALYLDTDDNSSTGRSIQGMGADVSWRFGWRSGVVYRATGNLTYYWADAEVIALPTVTSNEFEISFRRDGDGGASEPLFPGSSFRWLMVDEASAGDRVPNSGQIGPRYIFDETPVPSYQSIPLLKQSSNHLRVVSYNMLWGGLNERTEYFTRILQALQPDILCFQEMSRSAYDVRSLIEQILPLEQGANWSVAWQVDTVTLSRYPLLDYSSTSGNVVTLLDLPEAISPKPIFIVNAHFPCCANDAGRQAEVDAVVAYIRGAVEEPGDIFLTQDTPILILGDFNFVGDSQQLATLLQGDIIHEATYGQDYPMDWDGSSLTDILVYQNSTPNACTWWDEESSYGPGRLDYMIYSDSVFRVAKSFCLRTETMADTDLDLYGLQQNDCSEASDHFPLVADFILYPSDQVWSCY